MATLNIYNPTGTRGNWSVAVEGGEVVASAIAGWTAAVDAAKTIAKTMGVTDILLHKINGTVTPISIRKASGALQDVPAVLEGDAVYIARVERDFDGDSKNDSSKESNTLADAVKTLPRKAHDLNWAGVAANGFDSYTLDDGRVVSIERTSN